MPLPVDFAWFSDLHSPGKLRLKIGGQYGREVVLVSERVDGAGWSVTTNRQLDHAFRGHAVLPTESLAQRMATRWAEFHADRLRAECAQADARVHRMQSAPTPYRDASL
jgi:hypothetical protein